MLKNTKCINSIDNTENMHNTNKSKNTNNIKNIFLADAAYAVGVYLH